MHRQRRLSRARTRRITAAETGAGLQHVRQPQMSQLTLAR